MFLPRLLDLLAPPCLLPERTRSYHRLIWLIGIALFLWLVLSRPEISEVR